jgi:hypothetical protein
MACDEKQALIMILSIRSQIIESEIIFSLEKCLGLSAGQLASTAAFTPCNELNNDVTIYFVLALSMKTVCTSFGLFMVL